MKLSNVENFLNKYKNRKGKHLPIHHVRSDASLTKCIIRDSKFEISFINNIGMMEENSYSITMH